MFKHIIPCIRHKSVSVEQVLGLCSEDACCEGLFAPHTESITENLNQEDSEVLSGATHATLSP